MGETRGCNSLTREIPLPKRSGMRMRGENPALPWRPASHTLPTRCVKRQESASRPNFHATRGRSSRSRIQLPLRHGVRGGWIAALRSVSAWAMARVQSSAT